jgi:hypothetical protein
MGRHSAIRRMAWCSADGLVRGCSASIRLRAEGRPSGPTFPTGNRLLEIGGDDSGYSRLSPKTDAHGAVKNAR